jgi:hypothetical protein
MKTLSVVLALLVAAVAVQAADPEEADIIAIVDQAYVHGVHIDADAEKMRAGMHDAFVMFVLANDNVTQLTRDAWIERLKTAKPQPDTRADIKVLDRSGSAAVARVELFRGGKQIFTDYISLYRVNGEWKLVGKVFHRHP